jgi:hypothetical protein
MAPLIPSLDPERLHELALVRLPPEAREMLDALAECRNLAEKAVLVVTRYGIPGLGEFCRYSKADRKQFREAAAALKAVGLEHEGTMLELAAKNKSPPPPSWRQRQRARMRERVKKLREKGLIHSR